MNKSAHKDHSSGLLALMLFLVFAICILAVILGSTRIYGRLSERNSAAQDRRSTAMFIAAKVRQNDVQGMLRLEELDGADALVLTERIGGSNFCTWIYCHESYLYEIFLPEKMTPKPGDGEKLIPAEAMELELEGPMLKIEIIDSRGRSISQTLTLRTGGEEP